MQGRRLSTTTPNILQLIGFGCGRVGKQPIAASGLVGRLRHKRAIAVTLSHICDAPTEKPASA